MGLISDFNASIAQRIDDTSEAGLKIVPCIIQTLTGTAVTITVAGSTTTYPAVLLAGTVAAVNDAAYALWWPGKVTPVVFKTTVVSALPDVPWTSLTLAAGVTGTAKYRCVAGTVFIELSVSYTAAAGATTIVAAGGIPAAYRPSTTANPQRALLSSGTIVVRPDANTNGSITVTGITANGNGAVGTFSYPAA